MSRDQLQEVSLGLLAEGEGSDYRVRLAIRDRGMLLVATTMALRGDNVRPITLSDLLLRKIILINMGKDHAVEVCFICFFFVKSEAELSLGICDHE